MDDLDNLSKEIAQYGNDDSGNEEVDKMNASLAMLRYFRADLDKIVTPHTVNDFETALINTISALTSVNDTAGWRTIESAPKDGTEFQAWVTDPNSAWKGGKKGQWEPRCRYYKDGNLQIFGRVDYDREDWDFYPYLVATHWQPSPAAPVLKGDKL